MQFSIPNPFSSFSSWFSSWFSFPQFQLTPIIFPAPPSSYKQTHKYLHSFKNKLGYQVPYMYIPAPDLPDLPDPNIHFLYFHGNAEDIGFCVWFLRGLAEAFRGDVYVVEYPTYGMYKFDAGKNNISDTIKSDSIEFFEHLQQQIPTNSVIMQEMPEMNSEPGNPKPRIREDNTIVIGRSIGSGPATYLASKKNINNLILISPFCSIQSLASDYARILGKIVTNHFDNLQEIKDYKGRLLIIHGKKDEVINYSHTKKLKVSYKGCHGEFRYPECMTHNQWDEEQDIFQNIAHFIEGMQMSRSIPIQESIQPIQHTQHMQRMLGTQEMQKMQEFQKLEVQKNQRTQEMNEEMTQTKVEKSEKKWLWSLLSKSSAALTQSKQSLKNWMSSQAPSSELNIVTP